MEATNGGISNGGGFKFECSSEELELVHSKMEVVITEPEANLEETDPLHLYGGNQAEEAAEEEGEEEVPSFVLYNGNGGYLGSDPLQDPLALSQNPVEVLQPSILSRPSSSTPRRLGLRSTPPTPTVTIYPHSLKVQRLCQSPIKPSGRRKITPDSILEEAINPLPPPPSIPTSTTPPYTLEEAESTIRTFIDNSLRSRKDPQCRHQFYFTIHRVLNECLHQNLIPLHLLDSHWQKYDEWAASSTSYRLGDHYALQYRQRANDPDFDAPQPTKPSRRKKSPSKLTSVSPGRLIRGMIRNMEQSVRWAILNSAVPLRDDLGARVKLYQSWHKYYNPGSELFLDFYWNALLNRTPDFYDLPGAIKKKFLALPPSPKKMKVDVPPVIPSIPRPRAPPPKLVPLPVTSTTPKNLDMDRLVKLVINHCLQTGKDPKATHKFYWTIHRSLETVQSLNLPLSEIDALWRKYDDWAELAYSKNTPFQILKIPQLYEDVSELPPPSKKVTPKKPPELFQRYPVGLCQLLEKTVKGFILAGNIVVNEVRDTLGRRRHFLESYVHFVEPEWEHELIDRYWRRLFVHTVDHYKNGGKVPPILQTYPASSRIPPKSGSGPKNLDMDRLIKLTINHCLKSGKDPRASHKFYWTIHRSLETVSSLNLSEKDIDQLWRKYDIWAAEAFSRRIPFKVEHSEELFSDVSELPPPPIKAIRPPQPRCLNRTNGLRKWLEKVVREFVIGAKSSVNNFREDLEGRRRFLQSYVDFIPLDYETDFVIDGYWRQLLRETVEDYRTYLELGTVVRGKMDQEATSPPLVITSSVTLSSTKQFSMDYLVKKVINACVQNGVDPRSSHKFYWTIHRCLQEPSNRTSGQNDMIWNQYDAMANHAFTSKTGFVLMEELGGNLYYSDISELPPPKNPPIPLVPPINQLFPNCPKSTALKKFLEQRLRQTVMRSPMVTNQGNYILNDMKTRRGYFDDYAPYVEGMECAVAEGLVGAYWRRLLSETRESLKKPGGGSISSTTSTLSSTSSSSSSGSSSPAPLKGVEADVIIID